MLEIEIDGKKVEVPEGSLVMDAARVAGTFVPHFCYHRKLSIAANCRMCLVEVEKAPKPLPACATPVTAGMKVHTHSEKAVQAQQAVMEFLLINHPLDCPICDQGGECQLQDLAVGYGKSESRYQEEKRVVFHKNIGPLVSMEEMSRCIHCTRCVRFGQEIAGVMELGMLNRGEHSEITSFVGKTVDSELSGNMIDLCPVGALTSKPFRYAARTWELSRHKSISPHDGHGSNLQLQTKNNKVMRALPLDNEDVNECWISDKDRFSYEGLNGADRLTSPMIKQGGQWIKTDWQTALEYVGNGLKSIRDTHGADALALLASPHATVEELYLAQKLVRGLGSDNIDYRLRQTDFSGAIAGAPWLGMPIAAVGQLQSALLVGATLRKDQPLIALRLRAATKRGAKVAVLGAADDDLLMPVAAKSIVAPSAWVAELAGVAAAVAAAKGVAAPVAAQPSAAAQALAASLANGERKAIFLGNGAVAHPQFAQLHALAAWIATQTGATLGILAAAANTVGAHVVGAWSAKANARSLVETPRKAYVLLHAEPDFDHADPAAARAALQAADMVVVMSPFASPEALDYADVLLPVAPFSETAGTFVSVEGRVQSFVGVVRPLGETRPAWKVLRVLGNMLGLAGFGYESADDVLADAVPADMTAPLNNATSAPLGAAAPAAAGGIERLADVPIYSADPLVRRAPSLQSTTEARRALRAGLPAGLFQSLGIKEGDAVRIAQTTPRGELSVLLPAMLDKSLPEGVVRVPAATPASAALGAMYGSLAVTRA